MTELFQPRYNGHLLAGVDEAGRGPLAGEVVSAAVILDPQRTIEGLADSKKLTERRRENLFDQITGTALAWGVGRANVVEIDHYNILQATMLAMQRAVSALSLEPEYVVVDGNCMPDWNYPSETVVCGDSRIPAISAASIVAKVIRDREMVAMNVKYPGYGFDQHKGYGTKRHLDALRQLGPCPIHRKSFEPIKSMNSCL